MALTDPVAELRPPTSYDTGYVAGDSGTERVGRLTLAPEPPS